VVDINLNVNYNRIVTSKYILRGKTCMSQPALIGKRVLIHKTKSIGIIETVEGNIISVSVHGEIYKPELFIR
jgi:sigma54-dependent transcription regulator